MTTKTNKLVRAAERALEKARAAQHAEEKAQYEEAAKHGLLVHTESVSDAADFYGLRWNIDCDVFCDPDTSYYRGHSYAVVPRPGAPEPTTEGERARRKGNKHRRAERHKVFERIRRFAKRNAGERSL